MHYFLLCTGSSKHVSKFFTHLLDAFLVAMEKISKPTIRAAKPPSEDITPLKW